MKRLLKKRGSVALLTAIMAPVLVMALAMGVEVTLWSLTKVQMQRIADVAAWAGARQYLVSITAGSTSTVSAQNATNTAADLAEINGASGVSENRTWSASTLTTTDNLITAQVVSGVKNASDTAVKVTVKKNISASFSSIFGRSGDNETIVSTAIAELVNTATASPQPCLLSLQASGGTSSDINLSGSASITVTGCSVVSNAGISVCGNPPSPSGCSPATINAGGTYAVGAITIPAWNPSAIVGGTYTNSTVISDPYASDAPLVSAFSTLASNTPNFADPNTSWMTQTISPGTYPSLTLGGSSNVTMSPGTYYVKGNVTFAGSAVVTGNNVTIISSGTFNDTASANVTLTPPTSSSGVGVPGVLFASKSTGQSQFSGAVVYPLTGVIYFPNGNVLFSGSANASSHQCGEVIAATITVSGAANLSSTGCGTYGTVGFGSTPGALSVVLVQ